MARSLNGSSDILSIPSGGSFSLPTPPLSFYARIKPAALTAGQVIISVPRDAGTSVYYTPIRSGNIVGAVMVDTVPFSGEASSPATLSTNWQALLASFVSGGSRYCYLDGTAGAQNTNGVFTAATSALSIGRFTPTLGTYYGGLIQQLAIYTGTLNDGEVRALFKGRSPLGVKPQALYEYWPMVREMRGVKRGLTFSTLGGTVAAHDRTYGL